MCQRFVRLLKNFVTVVPTHWPVCGVDPEKKRKIFLEEDGTIDDQDELMIIKVQLAYCLQMHKKK